MKPFQDFSEFLPVLVFFLPGFVSSGMVGMLVVRRPRETFDKCLEAFILTAANLALFIVLRAWLELSRGVHFSRETYLSLGNVALMTLCAILIGLAIGYEATNEHAFRLLRWCKITRKTTKISTWIETFGAVQKYVIVHLKDERRIFGWPRFYSDDPAERAIFLEDASWLSAENELINVERISIFLDKESGIELIEFLDSPNEQTSSTTEFPVATSTTATDRQERPGAEGVASPSAPPSSPSESGERGVE
jgi:hypothetical protein